MPRVAKRLHYRLVDVSSFKEVFRERFGVKFEKASNHRALDDIRASIAELEFYLSHVQVPAPSGAGAAASSA
jgi:oligoribonuclease